MSILLQAALDSFAVAGGITALTSGFLAGVTLLTAGSSEEVSAAVDYGVAIAGIWGVPPATVIFILVLAGVVK